ncbi:DUF5017 domain-containing protein [Flavobacterium arcticum]|uniref:DUF5017 domain-containing protein n=1 Tax=Flavobacterium arcticum TaxID=1784713 RepID=A0A345HBC6_9FLAO|nr:DUF5689 domain-containing protein [Flavobacterium arcticum]AXG73886.1 DUF5017 domain-containing protein [Flavobacterium arcticum]KAF2508862.1 DUF5017 domain-containing protein [Flavobacterium arcticum]
MKTNFVKSILIMAMAAGSLTSCVNDDDYSVPTLECNEPSMTATKTVQDIYNQATDAAVLYTSADENNPDVIEAVVVSSDKGGNFYKTIYLNNIVTGENGEQYAGEIGFSLQINQSDLFTDYGLGRKVYISLDGLYTQIRSNTLQIGALYNGNIGQIPAELYESYITRSCTIIPEENLINTISDLSEVNDSYLGRLIKFQGVQFTDASLNQTYFNASNVDGGGQTLTYITDSEEETLTVPFRTSEYADYAGIMIPSNSGTITGILTKFSTTYQFVSRYEADLNLTEERIGGEPVDPGTPFFTEDFQSAENNTTFNFDGWYNIIEEGNWGWSEKVYEENGYAEFSSFGSGSDINAAWLITPVIDLDANTNVTMQFETAQHHLDVDADGNKLEVFVITNFDGTDIAGATVVNITSQVDLPTSTTSWYEFVNSGVVNLSGYTGQIHIGFKYTGSGVDEDLDGAFQIDNVVFSGN